MTETFARRHQDCSAHVRVEDDWAVVTRDHRPARREILRAHGVDAEERASFGEERPLEGLVVLVGRRGV